MKPMTLLVATLALAAGLAQAAGRTPAPAGAQAYIISPADGAKLHGPVVVRFGLKGMGVAPAGVLAENTGHHHLFVDTDLPADLGLPVGMVEGKIIHFGKGQTETTLTLAPGKHTLQLLFADGAHVPFDPAVASPKVTITVEP